MLGARLGVAALALALGGCAEKAGLPATAGGSAPAGASAQVFDFPDIPFAAGSQLNLDRTVAFGAGDEWIGQLVVNTSQGHSAMFNFYKSELPARGWEEITSVRAPTSVLTYARRDRILAIQIQGAALRGGAEITMTVSPRGAAGEGRAAMPPVTPAPVQPVQRAR